jgi:hypothetical protein
MSNNIACTDLFWWNDIAYIIENGFVKIIKHNETELSSIINSIHDEFINIYDPIIMLIKADSIISKIENKRIIVEKNIKNIDVIKREYININM